MLPLVVAAALGLTTPTAPVVSRSPRHPIKQAATIFRWSLSLALEGRSECVLGRDVEVRIAGPKGRGLYAKRDLEAGTLIGRYKGVLFTDEEFQNSSSTGFYAMNLANGDVVDGEAEESSSFVRFINHSKGPKLNCQALDAWEESSLLFGVSCNAVYLETIRDVVQGEELLFDYGDQYWDDQGLPWYSPKRIIIDYF